MLTATYYIETRISLEEAALRIANEQSAGMADHEIARFSSDDVLRGSATVRHVEERAPLGAALPVSCSYPAGTEPGRLKAAEVTIDYACGEFATEIDVALNIALGEPQNLGVLSAIRLLELTLPESIPQPGPAHGVSAIRARLQIHDRPLLCAPIKPSVGLNVEAHVEQGRAAAAGGADIVKDDELCADAIDNRIGPRARQMLAALDAVSQATGHPKLYVCNLIGSRMRLQSRLEQAMVEGVEAVMVAPSLMGYDVIAWLRDETDLILFAHTSFTLSYTRVQTFGVALDVWVRIQRLLGADVILLPSWGGSFGVAPAETEDCVDACLGDDIEARPAFPAHSGSMNAATVDGLARRTRSRDFILTSGSGLFDHPAGPEAGARALLAVLTDPAYEVGPGSGWVKRWVPA